MNPRLLAIVLLFAVTGAVLQVAAAHWVFQAHHDSAWSFTDMLLLQIAIWPQVVAARLGYTGGAGIILLLVNSLGWALIGLALGAIIRRRAPKSQSFI